MDAEEKFSCIKHLARREARSAGRNPDEHVVVKIGGVVVFDDLVWRYPDFIARAEERYRSLHRGKPATSWVGS